MWRRESITTDSGKNTAGEKAGLRRSIRTQASCLPLERRQESDRAIFARLEGLSQWQGAQVLLLYHGMGTEPGTAALIQPLLDQGKRVLLPRCLPGGGLELRQVVPGRGLVRHPYGMLEPDEGCPTLPEGAVDFALVPGLAFDRAGGRLGQGGGYYDRLLPRLDCFTAGLCREAFLLPQVPCLPHDRRVDAVITEAAVYFCQKGKGGGGPSGPDPRPCRMP